MEGVRRGLGGRALLGGDGRRGRELPREGPENLGSRRSWRSKIMTTGGSREGLQKKMLAKKSSSVVVLLVVALL